MICGRNLGASWTVSYLVKMRAYEWVFWWSHYHCFLRVYLNYLCILFQLLLPHLSPQFMYITSIKTLSFLTEFKKGGPTFECIFSSPFLYLLPQIYFLFYVEVEFLDISFIQSIFRKLSAYVFFISISIVSHKWFFL